MNMCMYRTILRLRTICVVTQILVLGSRLVALRGVREIPTCSSHWRGNFSQPHENETMNLERHSSRYVKAEIDAPCFPQKLRKRVRWRCPEWQKRGMRNNNKRKSGRMKNAR